MNWGRRYRMNLRKYGERYDEPWRTEIKSHQKEVRKILIWIWAESKRSFSEKLPALIWPISHLVPNTSKFGLLDRSSEFKRSEYHMTGFKEKIYTRPSGLSVPPPGLPRNLKTIISARGDPVSHQMYYLQICTGLFHMCKVATRVQWKKIPRVQNTRQCCLNLGRSIDGHM